MIGGSIGIFIFCIFPCVFANFHVRFIYHICTGNLHGTANRRLKKYKAQYTMLQRVLLKPLLARPFEKVFVFLFVLNYLYAVLTVMTLIVFVLEEWMKVAFFCNHFFVVMFGIYTVYTIVISSIQLEVGRRLA